MNTKATENKNKGVTLIALIVTIIVLLILVGVTILKLTEQTSTLAEKASEESKKSALIEDVQREIMEKLTENKGENLTSVQLHDILGKYFYEVPEENDDLWRTYPKEFPLLTVREQYGDFGAIEVEEIYKGKVEIATLPTTVEEMKENLKKYIGGYVDLKLDVCGESGTEDDWRIFYIGNESGENRIFLISADYIESERLKQLGIIGDNTKLGEFGTGGLQPYTKYDGYIYDMYWPSTPTWIDLPKIPSKDNPEISSNENFMKLVMHDGYDLAQKTGNRNAKAVSQLLNTEIWEPIKMEAEKKLGTGKIDFVIGGSTAQMWCAAWNASDPEEYDFKKMYANGNNSDGYGYYVGESATQTSTYQYYVNGKNSLSNKEKTTLNTYYSTFFPHTNTVGNCNSYLLASPSARGSYHIMFVRDGPSSFYVSGYYTDDEQGIRPVICLSPGVQLQKDGNKSTGEKTIYNLLKD